ncbi:MAG: hypothetical protein ABIS01_04760 [Ferruginibacter sp.]
MNTLTPGKKTKYNFAEYMAMEENSVERHDFYYGELFDMTGGTKNHNNIILNIGVSLKTSKRPGMMFLSMV